MNDVLNSDTREDTGGHLFSLVVNPAFLLVAWDRVRGNKGARIAGVDGQTAYYMEAEVGVEVPDLVTRR